MTIHAHCYSKANSRRKVRGGAFIKSVGALQFVADASKQIQVKPFLEGDLLLECDIYYPSRRQDLDESLVMDVFEKRWYNNDRQIRRKIINGYIDKKSPRVVIKVTEIEWNNYG